MEIVALPFSEAFEWSDAASITELTFGMSGLRLVVSAPLGSDAFVEIYFPGANAFQTLQNCDHLAYWGDKAFMTKHLIYQMVKGGWRDRVGDHYMQVLNVNRERQSEWLVVGGEHCVSVVSGSEPMVRSFT